MIVILLTICISSSFGVSVPCKNLAYEKSPARPSFGSTLFIDGFMKRLFVFGGWKGEHYPGDIALSNEMWMYDILGNFWVPVYSNDHNATAPQPAPRARALVADRGKEAIIFGGECKQGTCDDIWKFKYSTHDWVLMNSRGNSPKFNYDDTSRDLLELVGAGSKGDLVFTLLRRTPFNKTISFWEYFTYNPATETWKELVEEPSEIPDEVETKIQYLWNTQGSFYYFAGDFKKVYQFDYDELKWYVWPTSGDAPIWRDHFAYTSDDEGDLYLYGGSVGQEGDPSLFGDVWRLSGADFTWTLEKRHATFIDPLPRDLTSAIAYNRQLMIFGGRTEILWGYPYLVADLLFYQLC